jgi:hypothetical protein
MEMMIDKFFKMGENGAGLFFADSCFSVGSVETA